MSAYLINSFKIKCMACGKDLTNQISTRKFMGRPIKIEKVTCPYCLFVNNLER